MHEKIMPKNYEETLKIILEIIKKKKITIYLIFTKKDVKWKGWVFSNNVIRSMLRS